MPAVVDASLADLDLAHHRSNVSLRALASIKIERGFDLCLRYAEP
jgi:hypothetical protein